MAGEQTSSTPLRQRYRYGDAPAGASAALAPTAVVPMALPLDWQQIWMLLGLAGLGVLWLYGANLSVLVTKWSTDAGWSHGFVVPAIALYFIYLKWDVLSQLKPEGTLWGLALVIIAVCGQVLFRATGVEHMSGLSLMVLFYGTGLFLFGWQHMKILWLPISYLVFALPPPSTVYVYITTPMQELAAELGVQLLPLFGGSGERAGTIVQVWFAQGTRQMNVEQACSGMRMLVAFFALAVALGYSTSRPVWQKVALAVFALPVSIICNGFRVTLTGVAMVKLGDEWGKGSAHEYMGLLLLGPALMLQLGLAWVLDRVFVEVPEEGAKAA